LTPEVANTIRFDGPLTVVGRGRGLTIPETEIRAGPLAGDIQIGGYTFTKPVVAVRALPPGFPTGMIVGTHVLDNFVVSLDQVHGRLRLSRTGPATITLPDHLGPSVAHETSAHAAP
jgi:hypothetical protein